MEDSAPSRRGSVTLDSPDVVVFADGSFCRSRDYREKYRRLDGSLDTDTADYRTITPQAGHLLHFDIDLSDYYVVIVGNRYGSVADDGLSYTEKEYDYAVEQGVPVFGFVHEDPGSIAFSKSEKDTEAQENLKCFRQKVMTGRRRAG